MTDYIEHLGQVLQHYARDSPPDFSLFPIIYQGKEANPQTAQIDTLLIQLIQKNKELEIENNHLKVIFLLRYFYSWLQAKKNQVLQYSMFCILFVRRIFKYKLFC
jgi:hypothetical protein